MKKYSPYKMKGHTLPGINQRSEGNTDTPEGRSRSSALQYKESPAKVKDLPAFGSVNWRTVRRLGKHIGTRAGYHFMVMKGLRMQMKTSAMSQSGGVPDQPEQEQKSKKGSYGVETT